MNSKLLNLNSTFINLSTIMNNINLYNRKYRMIMVNWIKSKTNLSITRLKSLFFRGVAFAHGQLTSYETISWTTFLQDGTDIIIYVSNSAGSDGYDGLAPTFTSGSNGPKKTIAAGLSLLRTGHADWCLLKKGDTFTDQTLGNWEGVSGRSVAQRMVVGAYGTGSRPLIQTGTSSGAYLANHDSDGNYIAFVGLELYAHTYTGTGTTPRGVEWYDHSTGLIIEDCKIRGYYHGLTVQGTPGRHSTFALRGSVIVDCYANGGGFAQGIYAENIDGITIEFNTFDKNGWINGADYSVFQHNAYIHYSCTNIVWHANITSNTDGPTIRATASCTYNVSSRNTIGLHYGVAGTGETPPSGGLVGSIEDNVILEGNDGPDGSPLGWGLRLLNMNGTSVQRNIVANGGTMAASYGGASIRGELSSGGGGLDASRVWENCTIKDNICHEWGGSFKPTGIASLYNNNILTNNVFQNVTNTNGDVIVSADSAVFNSTDFTSSNNVFHPEVNVSVGVYENGSTISVATWLAHISDVTSITTSHIYVDPGRTLGTYNQSLGGANSHVDFITTLRAQTKDTYDSRYTATAVVDYMKKGFL